MSVASTTGLFRPTGDAAYDALRIRYNWNAPHPPQGYSFGVGRGAKPFITNVEVATQGTLKAAAADVELLLESDRVEEAMKSHSRRVNKRKREGTDATTSGSSSHPLAAQSVKLSEEELLSLSNGLQSATDGGAAKTSAAAQLASTSTNARDTLLEGVQAQLFDTDVDVRLPLSDFTHKLLAESQKVHADMLTKTELDQILKFGSEEEQTTWITRSRVHKERGLHKQALRELETGCRRTGTKQAAIWFERMSLLEQRPEELRAVAEEAAEQYPSSEALWTRCIDVQPFHKQLEWLQRALVAMPSSESLWLRLLREVPTEKEKKFLLRRCLEVNEQQSAVSTSSQPQRDLSRLWGMLADLESPEKGRAMLTLVRKRRPQPSLEILLESMWFEEKHMLSCEADGSSIVRQTMSRLQAFASVGNSSSPGLGALRDFAREAALHWCDVASPDLLARWMHAVRQSAGARLRPVTALNLLLLTVLPKSALRVSPVQLHQTPSTWLNELAQLALQEWPHWSCAGGPGADVSDELRVLLFLLWECQVLVAAARVKALGVEQALQDSPTFAKLFQACIACCGERDLFGIPPPEQKAVAAAGDDEEEFLTASTAKTVPLSSRDTTYVMNLVLRTAAVLDGMQRTDFLLAVAKSLFVRGEWAAALYTLRHAEGSDDRVVCALACVELQIAKSTGSIEGNTAAEHLLRQRCREPSCGPWLWKKWLVHLRSYNALTISVCEEAVRRFPSNGVLWLLYLRFVADSLADGTTRRITSPPSIQTLRQLYLRALTEDTCRTEARVWAFCAETIEGSFLVEPTAARRLLSEAMALFGPQRLVRNGVVQDAPVTPDMVANLELLLVATVRVELRYADSTAALSALRRVLDRIPSPKPDVLLALLIDLTPRAARGATAGTIMRETQTPGPLTLIAVAKIYHAVKQHAKAAKLVKDAAAQDPRCGDVYGLMLALLYAQPEVYAELFMHAESNVALPHAGAPREEWNAVEAHVRHQIVSAAERMKPNRGLQWLDVSKHRNPSNLLLSGFKASFEDMCMDVRTLVVQAL